ncbi:hypothetical protein ACWGKR_24585 [Bacillus thuringiensis]|uniref:hypothetical protein n=1 Tax=Bacillus cereus group TaxID=86661 RepID=UPI000BF6C9AD|nr:hypothetical protein [Bacillus cereus]PFT46220.1 hypothetical protein COK63_05225 [Bacillus cereus]
MESKEQNVELKKEIFTLLSSFEGNFVHNVNISGWDLREIDKTVLLNKIRNKMFDFYFSISDEYVSLVIDLNPKRDFDIFRSPDYPGGEIFEFHFPCEMTLKLINLYAFATKEEEESAVLAANKSTVYKEFFEL